MAQSNGRHRAYRGATDEWYTPPDLVNALNLSFDLDPCAPTNRKFQYATTCYTIADDGLTREWFGRVWLNPPYGPHVGNWVQRLADHGSGLALVFARTETAWFQTQVLGRAAALYFIKGRLHFYNQNWERAKFNAGAPSVLVAYGESSTACLEQLNLQGKFVRL